jgi:hypothetical protein
MQPLFWKALAGLGAFDLLGLRRDFAKMHRLVGNWRVASRSVSPDAVSRACEALNRACIWYPRRVLCLQRSAVTTCLLRSLGVSAHMVMGAQKVPFKAHAWTEVNDQPVNERRDVQSIYGQWERC